MTEGDLIRVLAGRAREVMETHAEELTALDAAIGDGDHGVNMTRGFRAVADLADELAAMDLGAALKKAGLTLVMKVGGASGPLYGSALMEMGKSTGAVPADAAATATLLDAGISAIKARGRSDAGAKTMLDVLVPVQAAIAAGADVAAVRRVAAEALEATRDMLATKGRAAFLGERSIGHIDPGARSSALLINLVCDVLEDA